MQVQTFQIIPVVDVMGGVAVKAVAGRRSEYAPLVSPLCDNADPVEVAAAMLDCVGAGCVYVADLDAIQDGQVNAGLAARLKAQLGTATSVLWDGGFVGRGDPALGAITPHGTPVFGSETFGRDAADDERGVSIPVTPKGSWLSLDFDANGFRGRPAVLAAPELWPADVIVMTLARVGVAAGPDVARLKAVLAAGGPSRRIYAAGGVRDTDDLTRLRDVGCAGALVATAIHAGKIKPDDLKT